MEAEQEFQNELFDENYNENDDENQINEDGDQNPNIPSMKTIFVSGLPYTTTEEELREFFSKCGDIKYFILPYLNQRTQAS